MMNPILPASSGGGSDPALEGRILALEADVTSLIEQISPGLHAKAIFHENPPVGVEDVSSTFERQRADIDALNLLAGKLAYEIEQLKNGGV